MSAEGDGGDAEAVKNDVPGVTESTSIDVVLEEQPLDEQRNSSNKIAVGESVQPAASADSAACPMSGGTDGEVKRHRNRRGSVLRQNESRRDRLQTMRLKSALRGQLMDPETNAPYELSDLEDPSNASFVEQLREEVKEELAAQSYLEDVRKILAEYGLHDNIETLKFPMEVRLKGLSFIVPVDASVENIPTVYTDSFLYTLEKLFRGIFCGKKEEETKPKAVLDDINLILEPGTSYLVLGPPRAGKSSLLKAISGRLRTGKHDTMKGSVSYNGRTLAEKEEFHIENVFSYIDQLDQHAPRLTVDETFEFAYQCKCGGVINRDSQFWGEKEKEIAKQMNKDHARPKIILAALGLSEVKDTFVGSAVVRGVSGGQRRRVTVGEMLLAADSILCGDEISTGLDAASTYDMIDVMLQYSRKYDRTRIISLLQPSPETVSLFDEVILLAEGKVMYAGPVSEVEDYFADIGFSCPQFMDVADFLQMVSTDDGKDLYHPNEEIRKTRPNAPSVAELAEIFRESKYGHLIKLALDSPSKYVWDHGDKGSKHDAEVSRVALTTNVKEKYANSFLRSAQLNLGRFLTLWIRDKRVIFAGMAKNIIMGVSVGGLYFSTMDSVSITGALFQGGLFVMLGSMQSSAGLIPDRTIFYKHKDANFFGAFPFVLGRTLSQIPQILFDTVTFATILYFMIGLAGRNDAGNFFICLALFFAFALLMNQQLALFAAFADSGALSAISACIVLLLILFCGFIIAPNTIPNYFIWLYWWNPFAWIYRGLIVNEFYSARWEDPDDVLTNIGFIGADGKPFGREWIGYAFAYTLPYWLLCIFVTALIFQFVRNESVNAGEIPKAKAEDVAESERISFSFKPVTMSFQDVCYEVSASTSNETLHLLNNVNGIFRAGTMTALMGSSGAGKTTLMDVIALKKRTGTVTGDVCMNGHPQEALSFRRCSGFVEQFDVQTSQLTVRETILFSAKLRLDPSLLTDTDQVEAFVDQVMDDVELTSLAKTPVGSDEGIGLSTEQKKRLSIAVELAASPSIIFLDEPTSGLDARSALIVVRALRKIADGGRTICATIHQPSSVVFSMFEYLLLLRKGGRVVYHGPLGGDNCSALVNYFESRGAPKIELGENPANWMLRVITADADGDLAEEYKKSEEFQAVHEECEQLKIDKTEENRIVYKQKFATPAQVRVGVVSRRLRTIYWRSPAYNLSRILVSIVIAFVLGSSFVTRRDPNYFTEPDMRARLSVIFLTFIITGIMAILAVIPVMTEIRDMFYRHREAHMYDSASMAWALGVAEKWFILLSSTAFCLIFISTAGLYDPSESVGRIIRRYIGFWGFFTFNFAIYSYFGQLFVCLVKPMATAFILSSVFIGINNFFSGLIARPQLMTNFYLVPFYICPGQYVYNGMVTTLYKDNNEAVLASPGSDFFTYLNCTLDQTEPCMGTVHDFAYDFFGYVFLERPLVIDTCVLGICFLLLSRVFTWIALKYIRYA